MFSPWGSPATVLKRACAKAKIEYATANDFRRTFASWLLQADVPTHVVARVMGHTTTRMVDLVYGRTTTASLRDSMAQKLDPGCNRYATDPGQPPAFMASVATMALPRDAEITAETVPRDGIEPPTRGFSILCSTD